MVPALIIRTEQVAIVVRKQAYWQLSDAASHPSPEQRKYFIHPKLMGNEQLPRLLYDHFRIFKQNMI